MPLAFPKSRHVKIGGHALECETLSAFAAQSGSEVTAQYVATTKRCKSSAILESV
jgi:hypothetical protein